MEILSPKRQYEIPCEGMHDDDVLLDLEIGKRYGSFSEFSEI